MSVEHKFLNKQCINCNKKIEELIYDLAEHKNIDAVHYCYKINTGYHFDFFEILSLLKKETKCLTFVESQIKDIIE